MRTESIWEQQANEAARPGFSGRKKIQTAVVGGGMAGILTALYLKEAGQDVMVLEAARIGSGQTGRTTAKVTAQHGACCGRLIRELGEEKAGLYAAANRRAVEEYRRLVREKKIDCGWQECAAFCYSTEDRERMQAEAQAERKLGFAAEFVTETELPFPVAGAVRMDGQACFSPLRFLYAITRGLEIYENTPVKKVERLENGNTLLHTPEGCVEAEKVVFATHYPMLKLPGIYFARLFQERSYVTALRGAGTVENMYIGTDENSWSVRSVKGKMGEEDLILLGGAGHRTGGNQGGRYEVLREAAGRFWKGSMETAHWSAQGCMTLDHVPYIGRLSLSQPGWYTATGFGKWGMSHSMVAALLLTDLITGRKNIWEEVYTPLRFGAASAGALYQNAGCSLKGLAGKQRQGKQKRAEDLLPQEGALVKNKNGKAGAYRDEEGRLHLVRARCPHLGCELTWNPDEKSWDCPCHGSRFGYDGSVLDGPAAKPIGIRQEAGE